MEPTDYDKDSMKLQTMFSIDEDYVNDLMTEEIFDIYVKILEADTLPALAPYIREIDISLRQNIKVADKLILATFNCQLTYKLLWILDTIINPFNDDLVDHKYIMNYLKEYRIQYRHLRHLCIKIFKKCYELDDDRITADIFLSIVMIKDIFQKLQESYNSQEQLVELALEGYTVYNNSISTKKEKAKILIKKIDAYFDKK